MRACVKVFVKSLGTDVLLCLCGSAYSCLRVSLHFRSDIDVHHGRRVSNLQSRWRARFSRRTFVGRKMLRKDNENFASIKLGMIGITSPKFFNILQTIILPSEGYIILLFNMVPHVRKIVRGKFVLRFKWYRCTINHEVQNDRDSSS